MTTKPSTQFLRLSKIAVSVERYATGLAFSLGNFHGTNEFGRDKPALDEWDVVLIDEATVELAVSDRGTTAFSVERASTAEGRA